MNESDRELLIWAAKAIGMGPLSWTEPDGTKIVTNVRWNPLIDNGQAFELLVLLQLPFSFIILLPNEKSNTVACGSRWDEKECLFYAFEESLSRDPLAAARRAIVRAAAEIGRNMK